ncbi:fungal-specific transcription factor domain-containing protein [Aspergillus bertholletiae]|uniref:Fungal-specific transcription factor domain-containing protein n=1 Tax=Aspergillus bertholletiae TaxID=1226010 RepID=A0A5N7B0M3_9EURO|nr:fungal-specific transcription factor domain-containing protein [Aspergillus bertholletiae]
MASASTGIDGAHPSLPTTASAGNLCTSFGHDTQASGPVNEKERTGMPRLASDAMSLNICEPLSAYPSFSNAYSSPGWPRILDKPSFRTHFDFYFDQTAKLLTTRHTPCNPFVSYVIPYALNDDLITHSVLALGASHYSCAEGQIASTSAASHYAVAIRGVRQRLLGLNAPLSSPSEYRVVLLLAILLLCQFECINGNQMEGILCHLRAARELLLQLAQCQHATDHRMHGFLSEIYSFMTIVSRTSVTGIQPPLKSDEGEMMLSGIELNRGVDPYGLLFACAHNLFEIIIAVDKLRSTSTTYSSISRHEKFRALEHKIKTWGPPDILAESLDPETISDYRTAGRIHQQAVLVYLYTTYYGSEGREQEEALKSVEPCIDLATDLINSMPCTRPVWTSLLWSTVVLGSCIRDPSQIQSLTLSLRSSPYHFFGCRKAMDILSDVWKRGWYGPIGIRKALAERKTTLCLA